jgi:hypothetical protein
MLRRWRSWSLPTRISIFATIVLGLAPFIWAYWIGYRESYAWAPARKSVLAEVGNTYARLFYLAHDVAKPNDGSVQTDSPSALHYQQNIALIGFSQNALARLQEAIKLNNASPDSGILPKVTAFAQDADKLLASLSYFSEFPNPRWDKWDFVTESPSKLFHQLTDDIQVLHEIYPDVLTSGRDLPSNLPSVSELDYLWTDFGHNSKRIFFVPEKYTWKRGVEPIVLDIANLRRLSVPPSDQNQQRAIYVLYKYR